MRHFLKFIDAYEKWDAHGFNIKVRGPVYIAVPANCGESSHFEQKGGAFRLNWSRPETCKSSPACIPLLFGSRRLTST